MAGIDTYDGSALGTYGDDLVLEDPGFLFPSTNWLEPFGFALTRQGAASLTQGQGALSATGHVGSAYSNAVLALTPKHYWRMIALAGTTETDLGSIPANITYSGSPALNQGSLITSDPTSNSVSFSGNGFGQIAAAAGVVDNIPSGGGMIAWVSISATQPNYAIVCNWNGFVLALQANGSQTAGDFIGWANFSIFRNSATQVPNDGTVHMLAVINDPTLGLRLYFDAVGVFTDTQQASSGSSGGTIGSILGSNNVFKGRIGEVAFFPSLTPTNISNLFTIANPAITGTAAVTQARGALSATAKEVYTSTAAITQGRGALAATGNVSTSAITGTAAVTQARGALSATAKEVYTSTAAVTQGRGSLAATTKEVYTSTAAVTQARGALAATGLVAQVVANAAVTQARGTLSATAKEVYTSTAAVTQARGSLAATAKEVYTSTVAVTQARGALAATAKEVYSGSAAITQTRATLAAAAQEVYTSTAAVTQARGQLAASGVVAVAITGTAAITQARAAISATDKEVFTATVALTQSRAQISALAKEVVAGSGTLLQTRATLVATAGEVFLSTVALTQVRGGITGAAFTFVGIGGHAAVTQTRAALSATGHVNTNSDVAIVQTRAALSATGQLVLPGTVAISQARSTIATAGRLLLSGSAAITQARAQINSAGTIANPVNATAALIQPSASLSITGRVLNPIIGNTSLLQSRGILSSAGSVANPIFATAALVQSRGRLAATGFAAAHGTLVGTVALTQARAMIAQGVATIIHPAVGWVVDFEGRTDVSTSVAILNSIAAQIAGVSPNIVVTNADYVLGPYSPLSLTMAQMKIQGVILALSDSEQDLLATAIERVVRGLSLAPGITKIFFSVG